MAQSRDITIDQGANFKMIIDYRNPDNTGIPLTGATFLFQVKDRIGGTTLANFSSHVTLVSAVPGRVVVNVPYTVTDAQGWDMGMYDILMTLNGERIRLSQGRAFVSKKVSA